MAFNSKVNAMIIPVSADLDGTAGDEFYLQGESSYGYP